MEKRTIKIIPKGNHEEIRIERCAFHGQPMVDIRQYWEPDGKAGMVATKKGIKFSMRLLPEVLAGLKDALGEMARETPEKRRE